MKTPREIAEEIMRAAPSAATERGRLALGVPGPSRDSVIMTGIEAAIAAERCPDGMKSRPLPAFGIPDDVVERLERHDAIRGTGPR